MMNIHEQVKNTPQVIEKYLKENVCKLPQKMTHHSYLTHMANAIIDNDTGKDLNHCQVSKHTKYKKIRKQSFASKLGRLTQGEGRQV